MKFIYPIESKNKVRMCNIVAMNFDSIHANPINEMIHKNKAERLPRRKREPAAQLKHNIQLWKERKEMLIFWSE